MPERDPRLIGAWQRVARGDCAAGYPVDWRLAANGLYAGTADPPGAFTWWDSGTWAVPGAGRLALSTANDAVVTYDSALDGDMLTLVDPSGCRFAYRRLP